MATQAPVDEARTEQDDPHDSASPSLMRLLHELTTLAELQARLFRIDAREARLGAAGSVALLAAGAVVALGTVPVLLLIPALALWEFAGWPLTGAMGLSFAVGAAGASLLFAVGRSKLRGAASPFTRSADEFGKNVAWLKRRLKGSARPA